MLWCFVEQKTAYEMLRSLVGQKTAYEMLRSLVGSEMCIRDRPAHGSAGRVPVENQVGAVPGAHHGSVSYTHLRAHETPEHLVCRLLPTRLLSISYAVFCLQKNPEHLVCRLLLAKNQ